MKREILKFYWLFWLILFLLFSAYQLIKHNFILPHNLLFWPGAHFLSLLLLSPLVIHLFFVKKPTFIAHLIFAVVFGVFHFILEGLIILLGERLLQFQEHYSFSGLVAHFQNNPYYIITGIGWYVVIVILLFLFFYKDRAKKNELDLKKAEKMLDQSSLESMTYRLNPHFLFNAMNNINMLIRKNENKKAIDMSATLSQLFRRSMAPESDPFIRLKDELVFLQQYIDLEMLRHEDNVKVNVYAEENTGNPKIPKMLIQPLVENAFKHGIDQHHEQSEISITILKKDDLLVLHVFNSGVFDSSWNIGKTKGIGLHHTVHRLRQMYNDRYSFTIKEEKEGVRVIITMPYEE